MRYPHSRKLPKAQARKTPKPAKPLTLNAKPLNPKLPNHSDSEVGLVTELSSRL